MSEQYPNDHEQQFTTPPAPPYDPYYIPAPPARRKPRRPRTALVAVLVGVACWLGGCATGFGAGSGAEPPTDTRTSTPSPLATEETSEPSDEPTTDEQTTEPTSWDAITQRQWRVIAKDPDAHVGEAIVVYGQVTQFDGATGTDTFLADVGGVQDSCDYGICTYPTNTLLTGDEGKLSKLVEEDVFRAKVTVAGSQDYDTQIGGQTTVPLLQVDRVKVLS